MREEHINAFHDVPYLNLAREIYLKGTRKTDRTGIGTRAVFSRQMRFDLSRGFPLLTIKQTFLRGVLEELFWILRGETNIRPLVLKDVHIWNEWPFIAFLKRMKIDPKKFMEDGELWKNGLAEFVSRIKEDEQFALEFGDLGPVYGSQWRNWQTFVEYEHPDIPDGQTLYLKGKPVDQIAELIEQLRTNPDSRSIIVTAWNPSEYKWLRANSLPPCHMMFQCDVSDGKLSLDLTQRSCDFFLGVPFNIASYSALLMMLAHITGLEVGEFIWNGKNVHLYSNHMGATRLMLSRDPRPSPDLHITRTVKSIEDFKYEDFELINYNPHPKIPAPVAV